MSQVWKAVVNECFNLTANVCDIETETRANGMVHNKVKVAETYKKHMKIMFATDSFYETEKPEFKSIMLQRGTKDRDGWKYNRD